MPQPATFAISSSTSSLTNRKGAVNVAVQSPNRELLYYLAPMPAPIGSPSSWTPADPVAGVNSTLSTPAIAVQPNGEVNIVALGQFGVVMWSNPAPGLASWTPVEVPGTSGTVQATPAIGLRPGGLVDILAVANDGGLVYYSATGPATWAPNPIPGATRASDAAMVMRPTGEVDIVAVQPSKSLMYFWNTTPENSAKWESREIAAVFASTGFAMAVRPTGQVDVAVIGRNLPPTEIEADLLTYYWSTAPDSTKSKWNSQFLGAVAPPNESTTGPAIAVLPNGEVHILFVRRFVSVNPKFVLPSAPALEDSVSGPLLSNLNSLTTYPAMLLNPTQTEELDAVYFNDPYLGYFRFDGKTWWPEQIDNLSGK
jgi:hypothetical protein